MRYSKPFIFATLLVASSQIHAQNFTYVDDEAEASGYDVTAKFKGGSSELSLAEAENGDGYRLKVSSNAVELDAHVAKKSQRLALVSTKVLPGDIVVQRRGPRFRVIAAGRVIMEAEDARWPEGKIGYSGGFSDIRVQPIESISFADDFMRDAKAVLVKQAAGSETIWRAVKGSWATSGLTENEQAQVQQTTNPFIFKSTAADINMAVAGKPFWSDYTAEVSVKPEGAAEIGLAIYVQDDKNYLLMHWTQNGALQLRAIIDGKTRVLDEHPGGFDQNQWYRLKFSASAGVLRAWLDDNEVLRARTGLLGRGAVALYAKSPTKEASAVFDDVQVKSEEDFLDDFTKPVAGRWQTTSGAWSMRDGARPADARGAFAVMGESTWNDYLASADITLPADGAAGLVLHQVRGKGAYWLRFAGSKSKLPYAGKAQIVLMAGPKDTVIGESRIGSQFDGKQTRWNFSAERGYLRASANDKRLVDAFNEEHAAGRPGIFAQNGATGKPVTSEFEVSFPRARATWAKVPDLYTEGPQPLTMGGWSTPEGFWLTSSMRTGALVEAGSAKPQAGETLWHKGRFWGEDSVKFTLPAIEAGKSLDLMFAAVPAKGGAAFTDTAMKLSFKVDGDKLSTDLLKGKAALGHGETKIVGAANTQSVEVERRGSFVIVRVHGKDEKPRTVLAARLG